MNEPALARRRVTSPEALRRDVRAWAARMQVKPTGVYIQRMTAKWGSCSPKGRVSFASDLLRKPPAFRTLVVVHELLHLAVPNHGKLFRSLMSAYVPGWRRAALTNGRGICGRPQIAQGGKAGRGTLDLFNVDSRPTRASPR